MLLMPPTNARPKIIADLALFPASELTWASTTVEAASAYRPSQHVSQHRGQSLLTGTAQAFTTNLEGVRVQTFSFEDELCTTSNLFFQETWSAEQSHFCEIGRQQHLLTLAQA